LSSEPDGSDNFVAANPAHDVEVGDPEKDGDTRLLRVGFRQATAVPATIIGRTDKALRLAATSWPNAPEVLFVQNPNAT
jgi:hypothetical protein